MQRTEITDRLYSEYQKNTQAFQFDHTVANVFADMIKRSVPGYSNILEMIGVFTQVHAKNNTYCYDLGCSLGASTLSIIQNLNDVKCRVIGVDNAKDMVQKCKSNLSQASTKIDYSIVCDDIVKIDYQPSSVIVLNFTLQFIPQEQRDQFIKVLYQALVPGGILILSEKINFEDKIKNNLFSDIHHAFKKTQGYSDLEIAQKRNALENVLIPESKQTHIQRLKNAGFEKTNLWYQCLNFSSFFAIKN